MWSRSTDPARRGAQATRGARTAWVRLALPAALLGGCASPPSTTFRETYQSTDTGNSTVESLTSLLEVGTQGELAPGFEYRLSDRLIWTDQNVELDDLDTENNSTLHQPSLDLVLSTGAIAWIQGYELQDDRRQSDVTDDIEVRRTDILQRLEWTPLGLPQVTAWMDRRTDDDDVFADREDIEAVVEVTEARGPFTYLASLESERITDDIAGTETEELRGLLRGTYQDQYLDGRLTTSLSASYEDRSIDTTIPGAETGPLPIDEVIALQGLADLDSTPEIATLSPTPALIDDDTATPAGPNIGGFASGGETDWNIGLRLPLGSSADLLVLWTQDEVDPAFVSAFNFSVWSSDDGNFWTLVKSSAPFVYDQVLRRFRITIPEVTAEYVKVVNSSSPPAAPAVLVTELEAFSDNSTGGDTTFNNDRETWDFTGSTSYRVKDDLTLGYDLFLLGDQQESDGDLVRDQSRIDNGVTAFWDASERIDVGLRANLQQTEDPQLVDEDFTLLNGLVDFEILDTLDVAFNVTQTSREVDDDRTLDTLVGQARASALLLDGLRAELLLEQNEQEDFQNDRDIDRTIVAASLISELTRNLDVTLGARDEDASVTGSGAGDIPDPSERSYNLLLLYRPSDQLSAEADLEWKDTFAGEGLDQRLRLDWVPLPDGTLDFQFNYDRRVSGATTDEETDTYQVLSRWTLNPRAFLEVNYAIQDRDDADRTKGLTVSFNVNL